MQNRIMSAFKLTGQLNEQMKNFPQDFYGSLAKKYQECLADRKTLSDITSGANRNVEQATKDCNAIQDRLNTRLQDLTDEVKKNSWQLTTLVTEDEGRKSELLKAVVSNYREKLALARKNMLGTSDAKDYKDSKESKELPLFKTQDLVAFCNGIEKLMADFDRDMNQLAQTHSADQLPTTDVITKFRDMEKEIFNTLKLLGFGENTIKLETHLKLKIETLKKLSFFSKQHEEILNHFMKETFPEKQETIVNTINGFLTAFAAYQQLPYDKRLAEIRATLGKINEDVHVNSILACKETKEELEKLMELIDFEQVKIEKPALSTQAQVQQQLTTVKPEVKSEVKQEAKKEEPKIVSGKREEDDLSPEDSNDEDEENYNFARKISM